MSYSMGIGVFSWGEGKAIGSRIWPPTSILCQG